MGRAAILALAFVAAGCASTGAKSGMALELAAAYSEEHDGHTLLVLRDGEVVYEAYHSGWNPKAPHRIASGTKSFWGPLAAAAVQDGLLALDEPASDTITEWRGDARRERITIRQLLNFTSGLKPSLAENWDEAKSTDLYAKAVTMPALEEPGAGWNYGGTNHTAFGELLRRKLGGESVEDYLHRRILDPIGMEVADWTRDGAGRLVMSSGAFVTPAEWAKLGELVRTGGRAPDGTPLLDADALAACFRGSEVFPMYGLSWWVSTRDADKADLPDDYVAASGAGKQQLFVIPSLGLTIVRQGESDTFANAEFFARLLHGMTLEKYAEGR